MAICSLIYSSRRPSGDPAGLVESILGAAERNNPALGLTGALVLDHRYFLQLLEGHRAAVTEMFLRISQDPRHEDVCLIRVEDAPLRRFPRWSMHHAAMRGNGPVSARAFMPGDEFDPASLGAEGAAALFDSVAAISCKPEVGAA